MKAEVEALSAIATSIRSTDYTDCTDFLLNDSLSLLFSKALLWNAIAYAGSAGVLACSFRWRCLYRNSAGEDACPPKR